MKTITIQDKKPIVVTVHDDGGVSYVTPWFRVDGDGDPTNAFRDPCWQADTSLHGPDGRAVNALTVPFGVVNPIVQAAVPGIVLGCEGIASYRGKSVAFVVADVGPRKKIGEGSVRLAELLGMPRSAVTGGQEGGVVSWRFYPGKAAEIDGVKYELKAMRGKS